MEWVIEDDLAAYGKRVLPWLQREPVENTVLNTVLLSRIDGTIGFQELWLAWLATRPATSPAWHCAPHRAAC